MRKVLGILLVAVAMLPALIAGATEGETTKETYKDYFDTVSYSGNNGSLQWSGPWVEEGESDGPSSGYVQVVSSGCSGKCLEIKGGLLTEVRIRRAADLSGFLDAKLHFSLDIGSLVSTGVLYVEVKDGSDWPILDQYPLLVTGPGNFSVSIPSEYLEDGFEFRFCLGGLIGGDLLYIDDVKIIGSVPAPTTTTSTTSTSTTSTTAPAVTTTTKPKGTTSSTSPQTSTTQPADTDNGSVSTEPSTTTTTAPANTGSADGDDDGAVVGAATPPLPQPETIGSGTPRVPEGSGLRQSRVGLLADYRPGTMGGMGAEDIEVLGVSLSADFSLAAEAFEATRLWIAGLALLIAIVLVSGMDMRRARRTESILIALSEPIPDRGESESEA